MVPALRCKLLPHLLRVEVVEDILLVFRATSTANRKVALLVELADADDIFLELGALDAYRACVARLLLAEDPRRYSKVEVKNKILNIHMHEAGPMADVVVMVFAARYPSIGMILETEEYVLLGGESPRKVVNWRLFLDGWTNHHTLGQPVDLVVQVLVETLKKVDCTAKAVHANNGPNVAT